MSREKMDMPSREQLIDRLIEAYVDWRDACDRVNDEYRAWALATGRDDRAGFGMYVAALDAEERAAEAYAALVRRAYIRLWGGGHRCEALGGGARGVGRT